MDQGQNGSQMGKSSDKSGRADNQEAVPGQHRWSLLCNVNTDRSKLLFGPW